MLFIFLTNVERLNSSIVFPFLNLIYGLLLPLDDLVQLHDLNLGPSHLRLLFTDVLLCVIFELGQLLLLDSQ